MNSHGNFCVHGVKVKNDPLPSAGSEDVATDGGAQPKPRDTTSLQRRVWCSCVSRVEESLRLTCRKMHHARGRYPPYIPTLCPHCEVLSSRPYCTTHYNPKFSYHEEHKISSCTKFGLCPHREVFLHRGPLLNFSQSQTVAGALPCTGDLYSYSATRLLGRHPSRCSAPLLLAVCVSRRVSLARARAREVEPPTAS